MIEPQDSNKSPFSKELVVPDDGWRLFNDVYWTNVLLEKGNYALKVYFVSGMVNMCSASVFLSNRNNRPTMKPVSKPSYPPYSKPTQ